MLSKYKADAQQAVNYLFADHLIPFKLSAHKVTDEGSCEYRIHFYDSRLHSIIINSGVTTPIEQQVKAAVLLRLDARKRELLQDVATDKPTQLGQFLRATLLSQTAAEPVGIFSKRHLA
jgi:hypothetical protein